MSNVIKSQVAQTKKSDKRLISIKQVMPHQEHKATTEAYDSIKEDIIAQRELAVQQLADAKLEAEQLITAAKSKAETMRDEIVQEKERLLQEIEVLRQEAMKQGYEEGYEQGLQQGFQSYETEIFKAKEVVEAARGEYMAALKRSESTVVNLAIAIAHKIIGSSLREDVNGWHFLLEEALREVREHDIIKVYVHPNEYEHTLKHKQELETLLSSKQELYLFPDSKLQPFGCYIETPFGQLEASIDNQLIELKEQLHEKLQGNANEGE